jgi:protein-disulfide isomerase
VRRLRPADLGTATLVLAAVAVAGVLAHRELGGAGAAPAAAAFTHVAAEPHLLEAGGRVLGPAGARVKIVEFSDFQCPFCARVQADLARVREAYPDDVAIVYRHFPLDALHPHARSAGLAAECAGDQERFEAYHDALYADQRAIGARSWRAFAEAAGVPDLPRFESCVAEGRFLERVEEDVRVGRSAGVSATPTFVVGGRMFSGTLPPDEWLRLVARALAE